MNHAPGISVVIPVRNEGDRILNAVESVVRWRSAQFDLEIVVVDDASDDDCCQKLSERFCTWRNSGVDVRVVRLGQWSGIPYARNAGASLARGGILFITDANVVFPPNWDVPIRRAIRPDRALCAAIADLDSSFVGYGCALDIPSMGVRWLKSPYIYGGYVPVAPCSATIITARLFRSLGGYDTGMALYGAAEPEFSVRLWLSGADIVSLPALVLRHRFRPRPQHSAFLERFGEVLTRNYIRFGLLYHDDTMAMQMLNFYAASHPRHFLSALRNVVRNGVWHRREELRRTLKYSFSHYLQRFPGMC
jgi:glycosyltransferase involved in cell wall biosynthesis